MRELGVVRIAADAVRNNKKHYTSERNSYKKSVQTFSICPARSMARLVSG
jgi:hypothetical protein